MDKKIKKTKRKKLKPVLIPLMILSSIILRKFAMTSPEIGKFLLL